MSALLPGAFFGTLMVGGKLFGKALGAGGRLALAFGKLFLPMTGLTTSLTNTSKDMNRQLSKSKKSGVFRRGLGGITGRFGKLFRLLGRRKGLVGLLIGAGVGMSALLTSGAAEGGVFKKIGTSFGKLFTKVGEFGAKIANSAFKMGQNVLDAGTKGVFSVANGIGTGFTKLFTKVGEFGTKIGTAVSGMGEVIKNSKVFTTATTKFSTLFGKVTSFGSSVSTAVSGMGKAITDSTVFKALSTTFDTLFGVVTNFGKEIGKVASAAAGATADAVKAALKSVAKIGAKKPPKLTRAVLDALGGRGDFKFTPKIKPKPVKLTPAMMDALGGRGDFKFTPKIKPSLISSPNVQTTVGRPRNLYRAPPFMDSGFKRGIDTASDLITSPVIKAATKLSLAAGLLVDKLPGGMTKFTPPKAKVSAAAFVDNAPLGRGGKAAGIIAASAAASAKVASKIVKSSVAKTVAKSIPFLSVLAGGAFAVDRARKGEYRKAFLELASGVLGIFAGPGTVAGLGIDAYLLAEDLGITVEDAKKLILNSGATVKSDSSNRSSNLVQKTNNTAIDSGYGNLSQADFLREAGVGKSVNLIAPTSNVINNQQSVVIARPVTDTSFGGFASAR